jgi:hypothetical protein
MSPADHLKFMQYLEMLVQGIKSSKDWKKVVENKLELALETTSHEQQSTVTALQQLYTDVHQSGKLSNNRAAQYWNDLEKLHDLVEAYHKV